MKRRSFLGAVLGLLVAPFAMRQKRRARYVDKGMNYVCYSKRRRKMEAGPVTIRGIPVE